MVYAVIIALLLVAVIVAPIVRRHFKAKNDYAELQQIVMQQKDKYSFLVDRNLHVKETNFYDLNRSYADEQPRMLGNIIHCQTGCDSGLCGTGIACSTCPVRMVLTNSFKQKRDFSHVAATMHLYDANHEVKDVSVVVDGELVYISTEPHFIVNVSLSSPTASVEPSTISAASSNELNAQVESSTDGEQTQ